jgi:hypothetical protein
LGNMGAGGMGAGAGGMGAGADGVGAGAGGMKLPAKFYQCINLGAWCKMEPERVTLLGILY